MAAPEGTYSREVMALPAGPVLTARLCLRPPSPADVEAILAMDSDPEVMKFFPERYQVHDADEYRQRLIEGLGGDRFKFFYALNPIDAPEDFFGWVILRPTEDGRWIETGWRLARAAWGRGLAPEAAQACLDIAFGNWRVPEVMAIIVPENTNSIRVAEKIGMSREGTYFEHGQEHDLWVVRPPRESTHSAGNPQ